MNNSPEPYCRPSLLRHFAVILYDSFLLLAILFVASLIAVTFNGGNAIGHGNPFFALYLLAVCFLFYGWFWTHGGQTLGMRSWEVYLTTTDATAISWQRVFIRFLLALISYLPAGLGLWWQYLSKNGRSWVDTYSGTQLHYSKNSKTKS